jgi:threonine synthase
MRYVSTRGGSERTTFEHAILTGLCQDGGLFVPSTIPKIQKQKMLQMRSLSFEELTIEIVTLFVLESDIPRERLRKIVRESFKDFSGSIDDDLGVRFSRNPSCCVPLVVLDKKDRNENDVRIHVAELFEGRTQSFKDISMGFLCLCLEYFLTKRKERASVIVATTGDTGPAAANAIERFCDRVDAWVLYPENITTNQERQMTTLNGDKVNAILVRGCERGCDDIDDACARVFGDEEFVSRNGITSVNSSNIGRILAQLPIYFWCYFRTMHGKVSEKDIENHTMTCVLPTGGMGNAFTAHLAREMGLPMTEIVVANNSNAAAHEIAMTGEIVRRELTETCSNAIDSVAPYNLWRSLYLCCENDTEILRRIQDTFDYYGRATLPKRVLRNFRETFLTTDVSDDETYDAIRYNYKKFNYLVCPHTAVALSATYSLGLNNHDGENAIVVMGTAHPAKFEDAIKTALETNTLPEAAKHPKIEALKMVFQRKRETNIETLEVALRNDIDAVTRARRGKYVNMKKTTRGGGNETTTLSKFKRGNKPEIPAFLVIKSEDDIYGPSAASGGIKKNPRSEGENKAPGEDDDNNNNNNKDKDRSRKKKSSSSSSKTAEELNEEKWNTWTKRLSIVSAIFSIFVVFRNPNRNETFVDSCASSVRRTIANLNKKKRQSKKEKTPSSNETRSVAERRRKLLAKPTIYVRDRVGKARPMNPAFEAE